MKSEMIVSHMDDAGTVAGVTYKVQGELTPMLMLDLGPDASVYFEHHVVLTRQPKVTLEVMPLDGAWKRFVAGLPLIMVCAKGPVQMTTVYQRLSMGFLSGRNFWFNRFTGPGRVGVQTGFWEPTAAS